MIKCNRCEWSFSDSDYKSNPEFYTTLSMMHYEEHKKNDILSSNFTRIQERKEKKN